MSYALCAEATARVGEFSNDSSATLSGAMSQDPDVKEMLGTQFKAHPPIGPFRVEVTDRTHALTKGLDDFDIVDELYITKLTAPIQILMQTRFDGEATGFVEANYDNVVVQILYLRQHGEGAVL